MKKLPIGEDTFSKLIEDNQLYVDKTEIALNLINRGSYYFLSRPRRFGKSLFLSTLEYYYGLQHKEKFEKLFGQYYIGQQPTKSASKYLILKFDFSQMDTTSFENTHASFLSNVKDSAVTFLEEYPQFFTKEEVVKVETFKFPAEIFRYVHQLARFRAKGHKVYLLIDEYDHFANEILSFHFEEFTKMVGQNSFVRKFYEAIKVGTHSGVIDRIFITGISPLTLDSLTSGFNISSNVSTRKTYNGLLGFTEQEVETILRKINIPTVDMPDTLSILRKWYNGYKFSKDAPNRIYNPDMILYFAHHYVDTGNYPESLLDHNATSAYRTIRRLFKMKNKEIAHLEYLEELLKNKEIRGHLVSHFSSDGQFCKNEFISLLYYKGFLTIEGKELLHTRFSISNYAIEELFYQYFHHSILEKIQV